jgi:trigger factor
VLPEATDAWVRDASEFESLEELQADIRTRTENVRRIQAHLNMRDKLLEAASSLVRIDVPQTLVEEEMERRLHNIVHRLEQQGASIEQYLAATGQGEDDLVAQVRIESVQSVKADLALRAIVAAEAIEVSDEEVDAEVARLAERTGVKLAQFRKEIERGRGLEAVRSELSRGKALQFLVDHAVVVDEEGKPLDLSLPEQSAPAALAEEPEEESKA